MARVTVQDVAAGVRTRWAAVSALNALVPAAKVFVGRAEKADPPYTVIGVVGGDEVKTSGDKYAQRFGVGVGVYTATDPSNAPAVLAALNAAFAGTAADPSAGLTVPNAVAVIHCRPRDGQDTRVTGARHKLPAGGSANVVRVVYPMEVLCEGNGA